MYGGLVNSGHLICVYRLQPELSPCFYNLFGQLVISESLNVPWGLMSSFCLHVDCPREVEVISL